MPRRHAKDQDPEEVRRWLEKVYPGIEQRAARESAEIHWCDETGAAADQQPRRGYAREGQPARIEVPDSHIRMNMVSTRTAETIHDALERCRVRDVLKWCAEKLGVSVQSQRRQAYGDLKCATNPG